MIIFKVLFILSAVIKLLSVSRAQKNRFEYLTLLLQDVYSAAPWKPLTSITSETFGQASTIHISFWKCTKSSLLLVFSLKETTSELY